MVGGTKSCRAPSGTTRYMYRALVETVREPSAWCMEALCTGTGEEGICVGVLHLCIRDASV